MKLLSFALIILLLACKLTGIIGAGWETISWDNFDAGWENSNFKDGGVDAKYVREGWIRLRHNTISSVMTHKKEYDVTNYSKLRVEFKFCAFRLDKNEGFSLEIEEIQEDGSSSWENLKTWTRREDFQNGDPCFTPEKTKTWTFSPTDGTNSVRIRFKCKASEANERVYIDDVLFQGYSEGPSVTTTTAPTVTTTAIATTKGVGKWGDLFGMKVICIHAIYYSKDRLLCYGTDDKGKQRADRVYEVFDFSKGTEEAYHYQMNIFQKAPDIFCSNIAWDYTTGNMLITGGDMRDQGTGLGIPTALEFNTETHKFRPHPKGDMHHARWYATTLNLPDGRVFVIGGRSDNEKIGSSIPEVWYPHREEGFRELPGAEITDMIRDWWYPNCFVNSRGEIIVIMSMRKEIYRVDVDGKTGQKDGSVTRIGQKTFRTHNRSPSIMYRIDEVAMLDMDGFLWTANIAAKNPKFQQRANMGSARLSGGFALLADGTVLLSGGAKRGEESKAARVGNKLENADMHILLWDPDSDKIRKGPNQAKARLYHGNILLLPDGRCLSSGGGAPGPLRNLNGQLYFPPYLYDENNQPAQRPKIRECPTEIKPDNTFLIQVEDANAVKRVTVIRSGAFTHARNCDSRYMELEHKEANKSTVQVFPRQVISQAQNGGLPPPIAVNENIMIPGMWSIFTINQHGIVSEGCVFTVVAK